MADFALNPYLLKCYKLDSHFIRDSESYKGKWKTVFKNKRGLFLDIGCGNGDFLIELVRRNQEYSFIGMDISSKYLLKAIKKAQAKRLSNVKFIYYNAMKMEKVFEKNELDGIFLLFSDPYTAIVLAYKNLGTFVLMALSTILMVPIKFVSTSLTGYNDELKMLAFPAK